jgi:UDPglucose--hexose-1-phosphate uridylyltransferase
MIERNPITGDPLIVAPERGKRPDLFREAQTGLSVREASVPQSQERCPFCAGNEADTPPEIWRDGTPWRVRVFPNKFPATDRHEVIVESPDEYMTFDQLPPEHASLAVDTYINRYYSGKSEYTAIFKNHGPAAGASIPHAHSQLIGTPFLPRRIVREAIAFRSSCPLCDLREHPAIAETENYRWIAPRGSMMAYEQWIVPRRHEPEMRVGLELASLMQRSTRAMLTIAGSFNWMFINFPRHPRAHWYLQLFPRLTAHAGFELGTGSAINTADAADAASLLAARAG